MIITAIKAQVKNPERVSVYVDGQYALSLSYAQVLDSRIRVGLEITEQALADLKKASDFGKAYERALNYVMIRPRSVRELRNYGRRKQWPPEDIELIITRLTARHYLNDHAFAKAWVESRALTKHSSRRKLQLELKQKGVSEDIIAEVLAAETHNETATLKAVIAKKRRLVRFQDDQTLMLYLARQGFGFDDIKQALQEI